MTHPSSKRSPLAGFLAAPLALLTACCQLFTRSQIDPREFGLEVNLVQSRKALGTVVIIHGLNQRPDTMDPLANSLTSTGYHTYRVSLRGHVKAEESIFSERAWIDDIHQVCALSNARHPGLPLHIMAYSLGGLVAIRAIDSESPCKPSSMILIAPALSLRGIVQSGYVLSLFPATSLAVPNIAPRYYRRFQHTPLFWYRNTFSLYSQTRLLQSPARLADIPSLVFANPRDELVSATGLQSWLHNNNLESSWHIELLRPTPLHIQSPEHLMIDMPSLGEKQWKLLQDKTIDFLQRHAK